MRIDCAKRRFADKDVRTGSARHSREGGSIPAGLFRAKYNFAGKCVPK